MHWIPVKSKQINKNPSNSIIKSTFICYVTLFDVLDTLQYILASKTYSPLLQCFESFESPEFINPQSFSGDILFKKAKLIFLFLTAAELAAKKSRVKQSLIKRARSVAIFSLKLKERRAREAEKQAYNLAEQEKVSRTKHFLLKSQFYYFYNLQCH